ncbi:MAG: acetyl-CoA hydrolase/transferase family protein [Parabacteroides sp.]|jgi:succinate CoA transferase|uniref:Succinate CoA transferase n=2 Tax=Bacteroidales TaxID=171549 RepID=A0A1T5E1I6_9BACT|nr:MULTISPECIES: acetyl-CoA hydrolase/transferase family protein [Bacteroidales]MBP7954617.1 acetyl-CoA hydrolase/transferase family protein [Parabacteroides sp.]MDD3255359.1 acetyl-CoA hydrolase/transferase family protein [Parabacteroides sp.]MDD3509103.1 acetyl-CoA hydrolase/transferase family protein [Parabacteroides sp.]NYI50094.1 succinate CoA transferase [Macellibacteroides fermentans]SKB77729.1 succinate CoA transferase [Parabacteroides chartae]
MSLKFITAEEAAAFVNNDDNVGFSGFTPAGCPKSVPEAIAKRAAEEHAKGNPFQIGMFTGASTGDRLDGELARANAIKFRTPYQSNKDLRSALNAHKAQYYDMHLSELAQSLRYGFLGKINVAVIEAADVTEDGEIVPTCGVGITPTICRLADKIIVELNHKHPKAIRGMHDIYEPLDPPYRREIPVYSPSDRIGLPYVKVDPSKIVGVVETENANEGGAFAPLDDVTKAIGNNVAMFLAGELKAGRIPEGFLPMQSGVGNVANAVLAAIGENKEIPAFNVYTEVIQDAVISLMKEGRVKFASGCSLSVSNDVIREIYANLDFFKDKILLRPQEISNNPEVARRLGLITINTALEADIFGNINSTHVSGTKMMNGIGGSGDFTRSAYLSIFTTPSTAKDGKISAFVPMVSHVDHNEHSVKVIITEYGVADLRGKSPVQRAEAIINNCVHPDYRPLLTEYMNMGIKGHTPQNLKCSFAFHEELAASGDMHNVDWSKYAK